MRRQPAQDSDEAGKAWLGPRALAEAGGVSTDTLRHYERLKLLGPVSRTPSGYRRYHPGTVARVQLVRRALLIGFSLRELASVLGHRDRGGVPCGRVRALVGERLAGLEGRIGQMIALRDEMQLLLVEWDSRLAATPAARQARLLDMLAGRPGLSPRRVDPGIVPPDTLRTEVLHAANHSDSRSVVRPAVARSPDGAAGRRRHGVRSDEDRASFPALRRRR